MKRSGAEGNSIDDVILAESLYGGGVLARYTALEVGLRGVPGLAVNRHCAGGLTAVTTAAANIGCGAADVIVAGGVQSSSTAPTLTEPLDRTVDWVSESHRPTSEAPAHDMSITVGWNTARRMGISRSEMDAWALRSHQRAVHAIESGQFKDEIVPLDVTQKDGSVAAFATDEHPRPDTSLERLSALRVLHPEIADFSITAGNSSGINDAAAALVIAGADAADRIGTRPLAAIRGWAAGGVEPDETGPGGLAALRTALDRTGVS
ncbi:thiolase family protein, partial [Bacillus subtilis]